MSHYGEMMTDAESLISDFQADASIARITGWPCALRSEGLPAPHSQTVLPEGSVAVYVFAVSSHTGKSAPCGVGTVLKIGGMGPNSHTRFRYMNYNPGSSNSNLAKSILAYPILWPWLGLQDVTVDSVGQWIRTALDRTTFFIPAGYPEVLATLEPYIRAASAASLMAPERMPNSEGEMSSQSRRRR